MALAGCYEAELFAFVRFFYKAHGFSDVTVIRDDNRTVISVCPSIVKEVYGKIDVRSFLFRFDDVD